MKRKIFPIALMLFAGAIAAIISYRTQVGLISLCWATLISMIVFFALGSVIRYIMDKFEQENEERRMEELAEEGEVIEKELTEEERKREEEEASGRGYGPGEDFGNYDEEEENGYSDEDIDDLMS